MVATARFLGFTLPIAPDGATINAPTASGSMTVRQWTVTVTAPLVIDARIWLDFGASSAYVRLRLQGAIKDGVLVAAAGNQDQSAIADPACFVVFPALPAAPIGTQVKLDLGVLHAATTGFGNDTVVADQDGRISVRGERFLSPAMTPDDGFPIEIAVAETTVGGLVALDFGLGHITALDGAFELRTRTPFLLPSHGNPRRWDPNRVDHSLASVSVDLTAALPQLDLVFKGANATLPLHVEIADRTTGISQTNPLRTPLSASGYDLGLKLSRKSDNTGQVAALNLLRGADFALVSSAVFDAQNSSTKWRFSSGNDRLPLHVRLGDNIRPGTLLVAAGGAQLAQMAAVQPAANLLHGDIADAQVVHAGSVSLACLRSSPHPANDGWGNPFDTNGLVADAIKFEATAPHLAWSSVGSARPGFNVAHPGRSFVNQIGSDGTIPSYGFVGPQVALPLLPLQHLDIVSQALADATRADLNGQFGLQKAQVDPVRHESNRTEGSVSNLGLNAVFLAPNPPRTALPGAVRAAVAPAVPTAPGAVPTPSRAVLAGYQIDHGFDVISPNPISVTRPAGANPDYVLAKLNPSTGDDRVTIPPLKFNIANNDTEITLDLSGGSKADGGQQGLPQAILKFSRQLSLEDIAAREGFANDPAFQAVVPMLPDAVRQPGWVGIILFQVNLVITPGTVLAALVPSNVKSQLRFAYVAATPSKMPGSDILHADTYSVSARLTWTNSDASGPGAGTASQEVIYRFVSIDGSWDDTQLQSLVVKAELRFEHFLGVANPDMQPISIVGQFNQRTGATQFAARLDQPIPLLSTDNETNGWGPIQQVYFKGATMTLVHGNATVVADGSFKLRPFQIGGGNWPGIDTDGTGNLVDFSGLQIGIPPLIGTAPQWLTIGYPSLKLNLDGPRFAIGPLSLKFNSIGVDFGAGGNLPRFDWGSLVNLLDLAPAPRAFPAVTLGLRVELMKLPSIISASVDQLTFDFTFGLWADVGAAKWNVTNVAGGLSAIGFDKLDLNLFRFIELKADRIDLSHQPDPNDAGGTIAWLSFVNLAVYVLDRPLIQNLYAKIYVRKAQTGFIGFLGAGATTQPPPFFSIDWGLLGYKVGLPARFAEDVLTVNPANLATTNPNTVATELGTEFGNTQFLPAPGGSQSDDWLVGAGISVAGGFFQGRFLYQEGGLIGLALSGTLFEEWFDWDLAISVLYYRGGQPDQDRFYVSLTIPKVLAGPFAFMGGVIAIEVYANGSFMLDLGFPWKQPDGSRDWNRTLGAIMPPFQASGGLYFSKISLSVPIDTAAYPEFDKVLSLAAGYAVQAGLGVAFGGGVFTVWVRVGLYAIIEGDLFLDGQQIAALRLSGAFGVLFQGHGELNFWIISASVDVTVSAEAQTTASWIQAARYANLPGFTGMQPGRLQLNFNFTLYASASVSACIRLGFVSLCKGITVTIPMQANYALSVGG